MVRIDGSNYTILTKNIFKADSIVVNTAWANYLSIGTMQYCQAEDNYRIFLYSTKTKSWISHNNNFLNPIRWYVNGQCRPLSTKIDTLDFEKNYWGRVFTDELIKLKIFDIEDDSNCGGGHYINIQNKSLVPIIID